MKNLPSFTMIVSEAHSLSAMPFMSEVWEAKRVESHLPSFSAVHLFVVYRRRVAERPLTAYSDRWIGNYNSSRRLSAEEYQQEEYRR